MRNFYVPGAICVALCEDTICHILDASWENSSSCIYHSERSQAGLILSQYVEDRGTEKALKSVLSENCNNVTNLKERSVIFK